MPKQVITKELIGETAFEIAKTQGISFVSEKSIAERLACSTRTIHKFYRNMDEVYKIIIEKRQAFLKQYYQKYVYVSDTDAAFRARYSLLKKELKLYLGFDRIKRRSAKLRDCIE